jgi:hypothetical protein
MQGCPKDTRRVSQKWRVMENILSWTDDSGKSADFFSLENQMQTGPDTYTAASHRKDGK